MANSFNDVLKLNLNKYLTLILFLFSISVSCQNKNVIVHEEEINSAPGNSSFERYEMIDFDIVKKYAPILNFHPKEGIQCCFPSCAEDAYPKAKKGKIGKNKTPKTLNENAPCYFEAFQTAEGYKIKYWFWYNYNDYPTGPNLWGNHAGDWEYLEIYFKNDVPYQYNFSNHTTVRVKKPTEVTIADNQVNVWVGKGSHANYESPNPKKKWSVLGFPDIIANGGPVWNTANNLIDIRNTIFCQDNYLGDWGDGKKIFGPLSRVNN